MPVISILTTIFGQLLCGLLFLPLIWFLLNECSPPQDLLKGIIAELKNKEFREYLSSFGILALIAGYTLGIIIDSIGHLIDDMSFDKMWKRSALVPQSLREYICKIVSDTESNLNYDVMVQANFYATSTPQMLAYHSEQWAYYEFFRNILVVSLAYLTQGCLVLRG